MHPRRRLSAVAATAAALVVLAATQAAVADPLATHAECPDDLACRVAVAAYQQNDPDDPADYGNYDLANRPSDGLAVRFIVIHDTEVGYDSTISRFQNPRAYVSAHYVVRSSDGQVTQMVPTRDVAWHAGNWWVNSHAIGVESEGFALEGNSWYSDEMYRSLARVTRYLADRYDIPLDRAHIIGHDEVPGPTDAQQAAMHWDPGPFFDWGRFMALIGAPIQGRNGKRDNRIVTIAPEFAANHPVITSCDTQPCRTLASQPANFVYLHTAPSPDSPLISDPLLDGTSLEPLGLGTTRADDWGDKAVTGQEFAVAGRAGDWTAIWYGTRKAWLYDPDGANTVRARGTLITPKAGLASIPVYGRAYPESVSTAPLGYAIPAGHVYVAHDLVDADYYNASRFNAPETYSVVRGDARFYEISFNHRVAFVKTSDVDHVS
jgi:N-acetyl-anhydromuramyl-L-alanine amidase AmpD